MATRQKLIHLHKSTPLVASAVTAVDMVKGEIAVRHAETNADSELYTLNNNGGIVSFPSKAYVDAKISNSNGSISGLQTEVGNIETAVGLNNDGTIAAWAAGNYITGKTTFKAAIEALDGQAKKNADAAAAAKSVVSGSTNITVESATGSNGAVTYTVKAKDLVTTDTFTGFKTNIVGQTGVDGNSAALSISGTNYINGKQSLMAAITALDGQAKKNADAAAAAATAASKHTIVEGTGNITVTPSGTDQKTYTVDGSKLATVNSLTAVSDRVTVIEKFFNETDNGTTNVIDTLKEIQDYIAKDTTGASEMTAKLANITTVLGGYLKTGETGSNTVIKDIIDNKAETTALTAVETTVNHIAAQAGVDGTSNTVSFTSTNYISNGSTLKAAIEALDAQAKLNETAAAKHTIVAGTGNITVTSSGTDQKTYTVDGSALATAENLTKAEGRITTIEGAYVDTITIKNSTARGVTASKDAHTYTIDLDYMIIDCGEY